VTGSNSPTGWGSGSRGVHHRTTGPGTADCSGSGPLLETEVRPRRRQVRSARCPASAARRSVAASRAADPDPAAHTGTGRESRRRPRSSRSQDGLVRCPTLGLSAEGSRPQDATTSAPSLPHPRWRHAQAAGGCPGCGQGGATSSRWRTGRRAQCRRWQQPPLPCQRRATAPLTPGPPIPAHRRMGHRGCPEAAAPMGS